MRRDLAARRSQIATTRRGPLLGSREDLLREPGITRRTMMHYRRSRHNGTFLQMSKARPQKSTLTAATRGHIGTRWHRLTLVGVCCRPPGRVRYVSRQSESSEIPRPIWKTPEACETVA